MKILNVYPREKHLKPFIWKAIIGPASIIDGIVETITLGHISPLLKLKVSILLAKSRWGLDK